ncbi:endonuclease/exonuclease/phosphatase family protein [Endozoicomonadaceae bacterium StTr2]
MKFVKRTLAVAMMAAALAGCDSDDSDDPVTPPAVNQARFAAYNLSFDRSSYETLVTELSMTRQQQDQLLAKYNDPSNTLTDAEKTTAKAVIQIRNVAETIQRTNPDVFVLAEFNNNGNGDNTAAIEGFQSNYLSHAQNSAAPAVTYAHKKNFATNTGLQSGYDLDRSGKVGDGPNDAWGFGFYHGQYAFSVFSKYPFDEANIRTFQNFKWKDMPGEKNIEIDQCDDASKIPAGLKCGDAWFPAAAWEKMPLSSKNHVDVPVVLGNKTVHFLVSHPAPPIFNNVAGHNTKRNRAEVDFWNDYIASETYFYDDKGKTGGLEAGARFVIAGDLNADPLNGDGDRKAITDLLGNSLVNVHATTGNLTPVSNGAEAFIGSDDCKYRCSDDAKPAQEPRRITNTSSLRLDYVIPSSNLGVKASGVFWPASNEEGYHLVKDAKLGVGKGVSSDHRLVWADLDLSE